MHLNLAAIRRGLKLLDEIKKVAESAWENRITQRVDIDAMQFDFVPTSGATNATFIIRQLGQKKQLYFVFADLEKAFDRVP